MNFTQNGRPAKKLNQQNMERRMTPIDHARLDISHELPHTPGPGEKWQESIVLLFQDVNQRTGGFIRVGYHPNTAKASCTFGIVSPGIWYTRRNDDATMRPGDRFEDGYKAEDFLTITFAGDTSRWQGE